LAFACVSDTGTKYALCGYIYHELFSLGSEWKWGHLVHK
jgi:hypothetical protein